MWTEDAKFWVPSDKRPQQKQSRKGKGQVTLQNKVVFYTFHRGMRFCIVFYDLLTQNNIHTLKLFFKRAYLMSEHLFSYEGDLTRLLW